jgi:hypothetical protein
MGDMADMFIMNGFDAMLDGEDDYDYNPRTDADYYSTKSVEPPVTLIVDIISETDKAWLVDSDKLKDLEWFPKSYCSIKGNELLVPQWLLNRKQLKRRSKVMKRQFFIAGVQFRPKGDIAAATNKLKAGDHLTLVPEPTNKFDPNAIQITTGELFLGYVPKKFSSEVSGLLGIGAEINCIIDEVNPEAKTYEMFKVTVGLPIEDESEANEDGEDDPYAD